MQDRSTAMPDTPAMTHPIWCLETDKDEPTDHYVHEGHRLYAELENFTVSAAGWISRWHGTDLMSDVTIELELLNRDFAEKGFRVSLAPHEVDALVCMLLRLTVLRREYAQMDADEAQRAEAAS
jgi:hypothetical protein